MVLMVFGVSSLLLMLVKKKGPVYIKDVQMTKVCTSTFHGTDGTAVSTGSSVPADLWTAVLSPAKTSAASTYTAGIGLKRSACCCTAKRYGP